MRAWLPIVSAIAFGVVLWQTSPVAAVPNYGLTNDVPGSQRVADNVNRVASYLPSLAADQLSTATITQTAYGLPTIVQLLKETGKHVSEVGLAGTAAMSTLISGNSGSSANLFQSAIQTIDDGLDHLQQHLPTTKAALTQLIGTNVSDRLADSFARIEKGLTRLKNAVKALKDAVGAAVSEAGSESSVSNAILLRYITVPLVYELAESASNLRAYLPVVHYTLTSSIEDAVTADTFLTAYQTTVNLVDGLIDLIVAPLGTAKADFYSNLKSAVQDLASSFAGSQEVLASLAMRSVPALDTAVTAMLNTFDLTLTDVDGDVSQVATSLQDYMSFIEQLLTITDTELVSIEESELIGALIHSLIDCGRYSRYCFHKYQYLVAKLLESLIEKLGICVQREERRLSNLGAATSSLIGYTTDDIEDVVDYLTICDIVQDATNKANCVSTISGSITPLGTIFGDFYALLYQLIGTELDASKQRVKMCVGLSKRLFSEQYIPDLRAEIESCATDGPA
ncbi:AGAP007274-PA-like protein [Anopheles sinensis]|uniref:AGAP007274-PA-like protein n=1 Tax=Anopheles sinensis TaxID=74873 RepID=A0A084VQT6_ANOSI|nr:AGAP007274-PA-like protein [Anopheles sinensis]